MHYSRFFMMIGTCSDIGHSCRIEGHRHDLRTLLKNYSIPSLTFPRWKTLT